MKAFEDFGADLFIDCGKTIVRDKRDITLFHMHHAYEILCVFEKTSYNTNLNGRIIDGNYPMITVAAPYCGHFTFFNSVENDAGAKSVKRYVFYAGRKYTENFGEELAPIRSLLSGANAGVFNITGKENLFREMVEMIIALSDKQVRGIYPANLKQKLMFAAFINLVSEECENSDDRILITESNYITEVMMYIVDNLEDELTAPRIAELFYVSRDKLNRDFQKYTQMNIGAYISLLRLNQARNYLCDSNMPIREIAARCGFRNDIYFYSFFKSRVGMTPREYAEAKRNKKAK